jgi:hypothetical protein
VKNTVRLASQAGACCVVYSSSGESYMRLAEFHLAAGPRCWIWRARRPINPRGAARRVAAGTAAAAAAQAATSTGAGGGERPDGPDGPDWRARLVVVVIARAAVCRESSSVTAGPGLSQTLQLQTRHANAHTNIYTLSLFLSLHSFPRSLAQRRQLTASFPLPLA